MLHFYFIYFFLNNAQLISSNCPRLGSCDYSGSSFLNIENDPSTSQEVTGAYLSEEIWGKVSLY